MITRDPDITRLIDRLEARGLVMRSRSGRDRRDDDPPAREDALSPAERTEALEKLLLATTMHLEALARLLVAKGIMTRAELMDMLKTIHDEYQNKQLDEDS